MKMTKKEIQSLIDRYFEAETSLAEEEVLRNYFQSDEVDVDLVMYRPYFDYFQNKQKTMAPASLTSSVLDQIKRQDAPPIKHWNILTLISKIAAIFILGFGIWFIGKTSIQPAQATAIDWSKYEVKSEEEALKITQMAFQKTSETLKKGAEIARTEIKTTKKRWSFLETLKK